MDEQVRNQKYIEWERKRQPHIKRIITMEKKLTIEELKSMLKTSTISPTQIKAISENIDKNSQYYEKYLTMKEPIAELLSDWF